MQATLPKSRKEKNLLDMKSGATTWTTPWAMYADESNSLWLNGDYTQHNNRVGTANMKVHKTLKGDYVVDISNCGDYKWNIGEGFFGDFTPVPVLKLVTNSVLRELFGGLGQ